MHIHNPRSLTKLSHLFHIFTVFVLLPLVVATLGGLIIYTWVPDRFLAFLVGVTAAFWTLCLLDGYGLNPGARNTQPEL